MSKHTCIAGAVLIALLSVYGQAIGGNFPIIYQGDNPTIKMQVIGTYRGGWFSKKTPTGPAYDPVTKRLFVGSLDRKAVEVLDLTDLIAAGQTPLTTPKLQIPLGDFEPGGIAVHKGVVAVVVKNRDDPYQHNRVLLFNADGELLIKDPIQIDRASRVAFTPNGRNLVVIVLGGPSWDPIASKVVYVKSGIVVINLGSVNWGGCRQGSDKCNIKISEPIFADFTPFDGQRDVLIAQGVRILAPPDPNNPKLEVSDLLNIQEGEITISGNSQTAWVPLGRNNAIAEFDLREPRVMNIFGLGFKDHNIDGNGLDASDKDKRINIRTWPIRSFYEARGIGIVDRGTQSFMVLVNQGDPWDEDWFREKVRLGDKSYQLNPLYFPLPPLDPTTLKLPENLGRLYVTNLSGDINEDGLFEQIYTLGSRSFSIRNLRGNLISDSGDHFERTTADALQANNFCAEDINPGPNCPFNCADDDNVFDARSDDRGPEPKNLTLGKINGRDYAFIGFERISGVIAYDITEPTKPIFQFYFNNRNFNVEPKVVCGNKDKPALPTCSQAGDLSTEGLLFIPKDESPIHAPLLAVTNETSDSTTLYRIDRVGRWKSADSEEDSPPDRYH